MCVCVSKLLTLSRKSLSDVWIDDEATRSTGLNGALPGARKTLIGSSSSRLVRPL